jgi:hypothetical protein
MNGHGAGFRTVWLGAIALFVAICATAATHTRTPLAGAWQADVGQSKFVGRQPYRSGKMTFVAGPDGQVHVICEVVTANGALFHFEYKGREDGTELSVTGNPYYDHAAMVWKDARTLVRSELRAGKKIGTTTMTLAPDGKTFTAKSSRTTPEDGHLYTSEILWKRAGAS